MHQCEGSLRDERARKTPAHAVTPFARSSSKSRKRSYDNPPGMQIISLAFPNVFEDLQLRRARLLSQTRTIDPLWGALVARQRRPLPRQRGWQSTVHGMHGNAYFGKLGAGSFGRRRRVSARWRSAAGGVTPTRGRKGTGMGPVWGRKGPGLGPVFYRVPGARSAQAPARPRVGRRRVGRTFFRLCDAAAVAQHACTEMHGFAPSTSLVQAVLAFRQAQGRHFDKLSAGRRPARRVPCSTYFARSPMQEPDRTTLLPGVPSRAIAVASCRRPS